MSKGCSNCENKNLPLTFEEVENRLEKKFKDNVVLHKLEDKQKVTVESKVCGHTFKQDLYRLLRKEEPICQTCSWGKPKRATSEEIEKAWLEVSDKYELGEDCVSLHKVCSVTHKECNYTWKVIPYSILTRNTTNCPKCSQKTKISTEIVKEKLKGTDFILESECSKGEEEVVIKHLKCGNTFRKKAKTFLNNKSCPFCFTRSKGEQKIQKFLERLKCSFKKEVAFKDLRGTNGGYLRYDFGILENDEVKILIEYDGEQHFKECSDYFSDDLNKRKLHDRIKTDYCFKKQIPLIRIPYYELENVESILSKYVNTELTKGVKEPLVM